MYDDLAGRRTQIGPLARHDLDHRIDMDLAADVPAFRIAEPLRGGEAVKLSLTTKGLVVVNDGVMHDNPRSSGGKPLDIYALDIQGVI